MSNYEEDLARFLDAWEQVQQEIQAQDRVEELAAQIGRPADELKRDLDRIAQTLRRLGAGLATRDLVKHALKVREVERTKRQGEPDSN